MKIPTLCPDVVSELIDQSKDKIGFDLVLVCSSVDSNLFPSHARGLIGTRTL